MNSSFYDLGRSFVSKPQNDKRYDSDEQPYFEEHQGIIFAIHLTKTMYSNLDVIFSDVLALIEDLVESSPNTGLGMYLFNCSNDLSDQDGNQSDWLKTLARNRPGLYPILKLDDVNAHQLRKVNKLIEESRRKDKFFNENPQSFDHMFKLLNENPLENYGEQLSYMFSQAQDEFIFTPRFVKPYTSRRIFLFTDCDKPYNGSSSVRTALQNNIHDLNNQKITVVPFLIEVKDKDGVKQKFHLNEYKTLFEIGESGELEQGSSNRYIPSIRQISLDKIKGKIAMSSSIKRKIISNCPLVLFKGLRISVKGYMLCSSTKGQIPNYFFDDQGTYKYVQTKTIKLVKNSGEILSDKEVVRAFKAGDQHFHMDKEYYDRLLSFNEKNKPILRLLGFRSFQHFNPNYTIGTATFIVPDESGEFSHSVRTFAALYQSLVKKKMMGVIWGMPRKISNPSLYYLIPTNSKLGFTTRYSNYPDGLAMIPISNRDQIRQAPEYLTGTLKPVSPCDKNGFESLITGLESNLHLLMNPRLSWYYKVLEDYLLQREVQNPKLEDQAQKMEPEVRDAVGKQMQYDSVDELKRKVIGLRNKVLASNKCKEDVKGIKNMLNMIANFEEFHPKRKEIAPSRRTDLLTDDIVIKAWKLQQLNRFSGQQLRVYINSKPSLIDKGRTKGEMIRNIEDYLERIVE